MKNSFSFRLAAKSVKVGTRENAYCNIAHYRGSLENDY